MPFYFWSLLIAALLPYVWVSVAKFSQPGYNNRKPRVFAESLSGSRQRAYWAHLNAFEALPFFMAAIVVAHLRGVDTAMINQLAVAWIAARLLHGVFYVIDQHALRSAVWFVAIICNVMLFWQAAHVKSTDRLMNIFS